MPTKKIVTGLYPNEEVDKNQIDSENSSSNQVDSNNQCDHCENKLVSTCTTCNQKVCFFHLYVNHSTPTCKVEDLPPDFNVEQEYEHFAKLMA